MAVVLGDQWLFVDYFPTQHHARKRDNSYVSIVLFDGEYAMRLCLKPWQNKEKKRIHKRAKSLPIAFHHWSITIA
jgi:hypothetical protein